LLNRFVKKRSFESTPGKFEFINEILQDDLNKNMDIEDSIPALASAIISVYDIRKILSTTSSKEDLKHVEYGIMKELENVWNMYSKKIVSA
jgi:hypothetical protein